MDNNTVVISNYWAPMEYRFAGSSNLVFRNNLVNGPIRLRDAAPPARIEGNLERIESSWFRDLASGDLHLTPAASAARDAGLRLPDFHDDLDGEPRPAGLRWDVGADEFSLPPQVPGDRGGDLNLQRGAGDPASRVDAGSGDPASSWGL